MVLQKLGIAVGRKRGFPTTPRVVAPKKVSKKPKDEKKPPKTKRNKFVSELIEEVAGFSPYEGRIMEILGNVASTHSAEKRPYKFAKKRVSNPFIYF